jgi:hypothetical protein
MGLTISAKDPVTALCRKLIKLGYDPTLGLQVWKDTKPWRVVRQIGDSNDNFTPKGGGH